MKLMRGEEEAGKLLFYLRGGYHVVYGHNTLVLEGKVNDKT